MKVLIACVLALLLATVPFELRLYWPDATVVESTAFDVCVGVYCVACTAAFWSCFARSNGWLLGAVVGAVAGLGLPFVSGIPDGWLSAFGAPPGLAQLSFVMIAVLVVPLWVGLSLCVAASGALLTRAAHHQRDARALDSRELILLVLAASAAGIFAALYALHREQPYSIDHWSLPPAERMDRLLAGVVTASLAVLVIVARRVARRVWLGLVAAGRISGWLLEPIGRHPTVMAAPPFHTCLWGEYSRYLLREEPGVARKIVGRVR